MEHYKPDGKLHVSEEPECTTSRAVLDESNDINPEFHILWRGSRSGVHKEGQENTGVCGEVRDVLG